MTKKVKDLFEIWIVKQFGEDIKVLMKDYSDSEGYSDEHIQGLYLGFNGGFMVANL
jgi:PHP family Zn ribbon phosphoesterase